MTTSFESTRVAILLSTYNGARYLPAQLDSIVAQTHRNWHLFVRDDGSRDETVALLRRFAEAHPGRVTIEAASNVGASASFLALLRRPDLDADVVAFCDQDDVWHADKLARAVAGLAPHGNRPALYTARTQLVDGALAPIGLSPVPRIVGFENALYENIAVGCATALNRAAHALVVEHLPAGPVVMHDWWLYLVVAAFGVVVYDDAPCIDYRQHGSNVVGLPTSTIGGWVHHAKRLLRKPATFYQPHRQAREALAAFGDALAPDKRQRLEEFVTAKPFVLRRLKLAFLRPTPRQRRVDELAARLLIALGLY